MDFNDLGFHVDLAVCLTRVGQGLGARCLGQPPAESDEAETQGQTDTAELGKRSPPPSP